MLFRSSFHLFQWYLTYKYLCLCTTIFVMKKTIVWREILPYVDIWSKRNGNHQLKMHPQSHGIAEIRNQETLTTLLMQNHFLGKSFRWSHYLDLFVAWYSGIRYKRLQIPFLVRTFLNNYGIGIIHLVCR